MIRRLSVLMSTEAVIPGVSGIVAPSTCMAVWSIATVTGKTKLSGCPGALGPAPLTGAVALASERLASCSSTAAAAMRDDLAVQRAEAGEGEGVELDRDVLADLDEADVHVGDQRFDLQRLRRSG